MVVVEQDPTTIEAVFGRGLKRVRTQQGMKQEVLARLAGYVNHSNIAKIEGGKTLPSLDKALALARILNVPIEAFVAEGAQITGESAQWMNILQQMILGLPQETKELMAEFLEALARELKAA